MHPTQYSFPLKVLALKVLAFSQLSQEEIRSERAGRNAAAEQKMKCFQSLLLYF
jgi:hypothetical protein